MVVFNAYGISTQNYSPTILKNLEKSNFQRVLHNTYNKKVFKFYLQIKDKCVFLITYRGF